MAFATLFTRPLTMKDNSPMDKALLLLRDDLKAFEACFEENMRSETDQFNRIGAYLLAAGGKRIRPLLLLLSARIAGYLGSQHIVLASVVESIHMATLLHDDVLDRATVRRGFPAANLVWGNQAAVLAGDYLLARAFSLVIASGNLPVLEVLGRTVSCLVEGEMRQLVGSSALDLSQEDYLEIVDGKTAALFAASCRCGALLGNDGPGGDALEDFGFRLGRAFQLVDDVLDYVAEGTEFGKIRGHDLAEGKVTLPLIHALRHGTDDDRRCIAAALGRSELSESHFTEVLRILEQTGGIAYCLEQARTLCRQAGEGLRIFADGPEKEALLELAGYVVSRSR